MREILFRGKRVHNGEWVYGYYCKAEMLNQGGSEHFIIEYSCNGSQYCIDPDTVGQYTGLTDKNGVKIFEGDIIRWMGWKNNVIERPVVYDHEWNRFAVLINGAESYGVNEYLGISGIGGIEVIGNIYDNPEV